MKIAVIAANGKIGSLITKEAVTRGLDVTAVVRHENQTSAQHVLKKDLFNLVKDDLIAFDAVVDAFGIWDPKNLIQHQTSLNHLAAILKNTKTRLIIVGGAGSLYVDPEHTVQLKDTPDFPKSYYPVAKNMSTALDQLRKKNDVDWLYISPAADFQADGTKTGSYVLAGEEFTTDQNGISAISYADYAIAVVDEIVNNQNHQQRISVRN